MSLNRSVETNKRFRTKKVKQRTAETKREERAFWIFILPWLVGLLCFTGGPMIASLVLSLTNYDIVSSPSWVGLGNYIHIFHDYLAGKSLEATALYALFAVPLTIIVGLLLAILLNQKVKGQAFFRTAYYAPSIISGVSVAFLWSWLLNPDFGVVNSLLKQIFGINGPNWFNSTHWVIPSMALMQLTAVGGTMVIFLAALQQLPKELYEAASLDGAREWSKFIHITVPLISPVILFNTIISIIGSFQIFTQAYVITQGGPDFHSYFFVYYLFDTAFSQYRMGYAAALAWVLFVIIFALTMLSLWISRRFIYYEYESK